MATRLNLFTGAYASTIVATYQPIISWISTQQLCYVAIMYASQHPYIVKGDNKANLSTALNMITSDRRKEVDVSNNLRPITLKNSLATIFKKILGSNKSKNDEKPTLQFNSTLTNQNPVLNLTDVQKKIFAKLVLLTQAFSHIDNVNKEDGKKIKRFAQFISENGINEDYFYNDFLFIPFALNFQVFDMWTIEEVLSPIGIAHYYRQIYFNKEEGVGPIEEAFTIAPNETLEVIYETTRKMVHEETMENGVVIETNSSTNIRTSDEVSDQVSSMIQRDSSVSISANASGSIGVWSVEGGTEGNISSSHTNSKTKTIKKLTELNKTASERITKSFKVTTRSLDEFSTLNRTRRIINNPNIFPVNYGLRRVLRKVNVKIQDLGPKLVWQLYLENPGIGLIQSKFVHFLEASPIYQESLPPGLRPRPIPGFERTSKTVNFESIDDYSGLGTVNFKITYGKNIRLTNISVTSINSKHPDSKDPINYIVVNQDFERISSPIIPTSENISPSSNIYNFLFYLQSSKAASEKIKISYTIQYEPSPEDLLAWENEKNVLNSQVTYEKSIEEFERKKQLITEKSKIRQRPSNDLRKEERYEIMNRMISELFRNEANPRNPSPLEIEQFYKFFDMDEMFTTTHPSWWKPKFNSNDEDERNEYEITAESEPARLGKSLGWRIQLDGDDRRNEFLNSTYVRICIPIKPFVEEAALDWLAIHLAGQMGYDKNGYPLNDILNKITTLRANQNDISITPDFVRTDSATFPDADIYDIQVAPTPENVYPIINDFDVVVPTEGFVYDQLLVNL